MGGAFTGLADDVSATYWNPAGLLLNWDEGERAATWMHTTTNRDVINYQDYLGYAEKRGPKSAWGVSYIRNHLAEDPVEQLSWYQDWLWGSYAWRAGENAAAGVNLRLVRDDVTYAGEDVSGMVDTDPALDLTYFQRINETTTFGVLIQDFNEPETTVEGIPLGKWVRNVRPGIAVRPNPHMLYTVEIYDALDDGEMRDIRAGVEMWQSETLALRAGWYGNADAPTIGAGFKTQSATFDAALMMGDLDNTLLLSATTRF